MSGFLSDMGMDLVIDHFTGLSVMPYTHTHPQYELYFCPENVEQNSVINGMEYVYRYPCAILSTPYTVHSMSCVDPTAKSYDRYVFYFGKKTLQSFDARFIPSALLERNTGLLFRLTEEQAEELRHLLRVWETGSGKSAEQRELIFLLFVHKLFDFCPKENALRVGTPSFYIQDVLQYVSEHFATEIDVVRIAAHFAVSRSKLERDFKRFTGVTVHQFAEICRLNQAKYLLQNPKKYSMAQIAERCGFSSETYLFPFFKKHTGLTPLEFRKQVNSHRKSSVDQK